MTEHLERAVLRPCGVCGELWAGLPDWPAVICPECALLDIRTPEEYALAGRLSLAEWDAYRANGRRMPSDAPGRTETRK